MGAVCSAPTAVRKAASSRAATADKGQFAAGALALYTSAGKSGSWCLYVRALGPAVAAGRAQPLRRDIIPSGSPEHQVPAPRRPFLIWTALGWARWSASASRQGRGLAPAVAHVRGARERWTWRTMPARPWPRGPTSRGGGGDRDQGVVASIAASTTSAAGSSRPAPRPFRLDLGLDRRTLAVPGRPPAGVELIVDLGFHRRAPVVNNVSFGVPPPSLQSPAYRDDKNRDHPGPAAAAAAGQQGPRLVATAGSDHRRPQAVLVSNNVYGIGRVAGLGPGPAGPGPSSVSPSRSPAGPGG